MSSLRIFRCLVWLLIAVCTTCSIFHTKLLQALIERKEPNWREYSVHTKDTHTTKKIKREIEQAQTQNAICYLFFSLLCVMFLAAAETILVVPFDFVLMRALIRMELNIHQDNKRTLFLKKWIKKANKYRVHECFISFGVLLCGRYTILQCSRTTSEWEEKSAEKRQETYRLNSSRRTIAHTKWIRRWNEKRMYFVCWRNEKNLQSNPISEETTAKILKWERYIKSMCARAGRWKAVSECRTTLSWADFFSLEMKEGRHT